MTYYDALEKMRRAKNGIVYNDSFALSKCEGTYTLVKIDKGGRKRFMAVQSIEEIGIIDGLEKVEFVPYSEFEVAMFNFKIWLACH